REIVVQIPPETLAHDTSALLGQFKFVKPESELRQRVAGFGADREASIDPLAGKRAGLRVQRERHVLRHDTQRKSKSDSQRDPGCEPLQRPDWRLEHGDPPIIRPARLAESWATFAVKLTKG